MISFHPDLRDELGLRQETPDAVYDPVSMLFYQPCAPDLATIRAVARDAGAAGWLQHGVTLGGLATRLDGLRRRHSFEGSPEPAASHRLAYRDGMRAREA